MFTKTKHLFLLLFVLITANASRAMATPPGSGIGEGKVKTELTYTETPELDKLITVHLKATALNDWPKGKFKIRLISGGVAIFPQGEDWPVLENMKNGSVFETDFKVRPYVLGSSLIIVDLGLVNEMYYLRLNEQGKFIKLLSRSDLWKYYEVKIEKDGWIKLSKTQSESLALYTDNYNDQIPFKPIITKDYIEYRVKDVIVTITPLPTIGNISKVIIKKQESYEDKYFKPILGVRKISTIHYLNEEKDKNKIWPEKGIENEINYVNQFDEQKGGYYCSEIFIKPKTKYNTLFINIAIQGSENQITSRNVNIGFVLNNKGQLEEFNNKKVPAFEVEK